MTVHVGLKLVEGTGSFCVCEVTIDSGQVCRRLWQAFKAEMGCKQLAASGQVYRHADGVPAWGEARSSSPCRENPRKMMARAVQLLPVFHGTVHSEHITGALEAAGNCRRVLSSCSVSLAPSIEKA